eukprot:3837304-Rhodomonas_salina.1
MPMLASFQDRFCNLTRRAGSGCAWVLRAREWRRDGDHGVGFIRVGRLCHRAQQRFCFLRQSARKKCTRVPPTKARNGETFGARQAESSRNFAFCPHGSSCMLPLIDTGKRTCVGVAIVGGRGARQQDCSGSVADLHFVITAARAATARGKGCHRLIVHRCTATAMTPSRQRGSEAWSMQLRIQSVQHGSDAGSGQTLLG